MIYIKESYSRTGLLSEKNVFYLHAIDEFVFDYNYYQEEEKRKKDYSFKSSDNGFEFYYQGCLWLKGYLSEKE